MAKDPVSDVELDYIKTLMCGVPQFDQLSTQELDIVSKHIFRRAVPAGTVLCREGAQGDSLFYIVDGKIEIRKESMDGRQTILARFKKGASVGEMSLVEEASRSATAVAIEDAELLIFTRENFDRLVSNYPTVGLKIIKNIAKSLSARLRFTSGRFADVFK